MTKKIIQIVTASKPLYAVFKSVDKANEDFFLEECPVVALVEEEDGHRYVVGLQLGECGFEEPDGASNFLGYASSMENAVLRFGKSE